MSKYEIAKEQVDHICTIIANHHSAKEIDTIEFRIVWDADRLVNIAVDSADADKEKLREIVDKTFKTCKGRQIAAELFLKTGTKQPIKK